jgi:hypothetical protein
MPTATSQPKPGALSHVQIRAMLRDAEGLAAAMRKQLGRRPQSLPSRIRALALLVCARVFSAEMRRRLR